MTLRGYPAYSLIAAFALSGCDMVGSKPQSLAASHPDPVLSDTFAASQAPAGTARHSARVSTKIASTAFGKSVAEAVINHPDLGIATADISSARADLGGASGAFRPEFAIGASLSSRYSTSDDRNINDSGPYLSVSQLIYDGGAARNGKLAAQAGVERAQDARISTAASSAMAAVDIYVSVLSTREVMRLFQRNLATHQDVFAQVQERQRFGAGTESDVLTIQSRMADAQTNAINAEADFHEAEARFEEIFGKPPKGLSEPPQAPQINLSDDSAITTSPRMRSLTAEVTEAEARLAQAVAQRRPRVELGGKALPDDDGGAEMLLDLSVEYSFDNRREAASTIDRAKANVTRLQAEKTRLHRDIRRALDVLSVDRTAGAKRLSAARSAASANRNHVTAARDEFSIGRRTLLEVLDAQRDYVQAQQTVVDAQVLQKLTDYQALALTGDIVDVFGVHLVEDRTTP